jgi:hypothetical protein
MGAVALSAVAVLFHYLIGKTLTVCLGILTGAGGIAALVGIFGSSTYVFTAGFTLAFAGAGGLVLQWFPPHSGSSGGPQGGASSTPP